MIEAEPVLEPVPLTISLFPNVMTFFCSTELACPVIPKLDKGGLEVEVFTVLVAV